MKIEKINYPAWLVASCQVTNSAKINLIIDNMGERVTVLKINHNSDNALVRDEKGRIFYCNKNFLSPIEAHTSPDQTKV